jgi:hypothetical protein
MFNFKSGGTYSNHCALKCYVLAVCTYDTNNSKSKANVSAMLRKHSHRDRRTILSQAGSTLAAAAGTAVCTAADFQSPAKRNAELHYKGLSYRV